MPHSVALTTTIHEALVSHLDRADGQEDLCFALYQDSIGATRTTALISELVLPKHGERHLHGNVAFTGEYFLRAADRAEDQGAGLALLHSHPHGRHWQDMSPDDIAAEQGHAAQAFAMTEKPLLGMTLATGDQAWSARLWPNERNAYRRRDCATWPSPATPTRTASRASTNESCGPCRRGAPRSRASWRSCASA
jgi:hypothetical protein